MGTSVSFQHFTELKGTEEALTMELKSQLLKSVLVFLVFCAGISVEAGAHKEVKKWKKKIENHHFMTKCWGAGTMMAFYKAAEKFGLECMQLTPAFDIDLFAEPDNEEYNIIGDEMENPFFPDSSWTANFTCTSTFQYTHSQSTIWSTDTSKSFGSLASYVGSIISASSTATTS